MLRYLLSCIDSGVFKRFRKVSSAVLGIADIVTDIIALAGWYLGGHFWWCSIGVLILVLKTCFESYYFLKWYGVLSAIIHAMCLGLIYQVIFTKSDDRFFDTRLMEVVLESAPFLLLQAYTFVVEEDYSLETMLSLMISYASLAALLAENLGKTVADGVLKFSFSIITSAVDSAVVILPWVLFLKAYRGVFWRSCLGVVYCGAIVMINRKQGCFSNFLLYFIIAHDQELSVDIIFKYIFALLLFAMACIKDVIYVYQVILGVLVSFLVFVFKFQEGVEKELESFCRRTLYCFSCHRCCGRPNIKQDSDSGLSASNSQLSSPSHIMNELCGIDKNNIRIEENGCKGGVDHKDKNIRIVD